MAAHGIPTAAYQCFTDFERAKAYIESVGHGVVVKASGLAGGKGVLLPESKQEAIDYTRQILHDKVFGEAGRELVVEELLEGEEVSVLAFSDGYTVVALPAAQDHKRAFDGDKGPNTGGMGCYAPAPIATPAIMRKVYDQVLKPAVDGMRRDGFPFVGVLFAGIMITPQGEVKTLEFNCRFGDPETEVLLPLLDDECDLGEIMMACAQGRLDAVRVAFQSAHAVTVIAASGGYPGTYTVGKPITLPPTQDEDTIVFHAGTTRNDQHQLVTNGGRVLAVTGRGTTLAQALQRSYSALASIHFDGMFYRKDIGHRATTTIKPSLSYADAGVSIDRGNQFVHDITALVKSTQRPGTDAAIGGFGGLFNLMEANYTSSDTILVAATDGVGTKLKLAQHTNKHDTIGIDLVAMNVNDLIVQGAEPLFFLDYFACGHLDLAITRDVVAGIADGCKQAHCALIGGETAEMPGLYATGEYDLAGFSVGAVQKTQLLPRMQDMIEGDVVLGCASSGPHSNGYSLIRKIVEMHGLDAEAPFAPGETLGRALLTPTRIYVRSLMPVIQQGLVKGLAHITGGGFVDNVPRVLPPTLAAWIDVQAWTLPDVFKWLKVQGNVEAFELGRTFNCGIGMVLVVAREHVEAVQELLRDKEQVFVLGHLITRKGSAVELVNLNSWD